MFLVWRAWARLPLSPPHPQIHLSVQVSLGHSQRAIFILSPCKRVLEQQVLFKTFGFKYQLTTFLYEISDHTFCLYQH